MVLLRHLVVEVKQHGGNAVQGVHTTTAGRPAEIHGIHIQSMEAETRIDLMKVVFLYAKH